MLLKFSGTLDGSTPFSPPTVWSLADRGNANDLDPNNPSFIQYPLPAGTIKRLRVRANDNLFTNPTRVEVYKNSVATGIFVSIPAATNGVFTDLVNTAAFAADDGLDLRATAPVTPPTNLTLSLSATLELV